MAPRSSGPITPSLRSQSTSKASSCPPPPGHQAIPDLSTPSRRKGSLKVRKWRSIFNLGRSGHETKRKFPRGAEDRGKFGVR